MLKYVSSGRVPSPQAPIGGDTGVSRFGPAPSEGEAKNDDSLAGFETGSWWCVFCTGQHCADRGVRRCRKYLEAYHPICSATPPPSLPEGSSLNAKKDD